MKLEPGWVNTLARLLARLMPALLLLLASCAPQPAAQPVTLTVMAAASLTEAFQEIGTQFEASHPGVQVAFNFAGSQQLVQQLSNAAPADVFASADQRNMDAAVQSGRVTAADVQPFARNQLVVITPTSSPALERLSDLARPNLKLVMAAPEVPVGGYSLEFLNKAAQDPAYGPSFKDAVLGNVVSYENNVKAVLAKVVLGEADAGIVYSTDASSAQGKVKEIEIPPALNVSAVYPIAVINDSTQPALARAFVEMCAQKPGRRC